MSEVHKLTKSAHIIHMGSTYSFEDMSRIYIWELECLCGTPKKISSRCGTLFNSYLRRVLQKIVGIRLIFISTYHSQTDDQTKWVNHKLEDMPRASVFELKESWKDIYH